MELIAETDKFVLIKGFIDARDSGSRGVHGAFASVSGYQKTLYLKEIFTYEPIDRALEWPELIEMLDDEKWTPPDESDLARCKKEFHEFVDLQRLFEYGRGRMEAKDIERKVSYFCSSVLSLNAITFLDMTTMSEGELLAVMPSFGKSGEAEKKNEKTPAADGDDPANIDEDGEEDEKKEVFLACEPILDPIAGIAISDLSVGDLIAAKLPESSSFFQFFVNQYPAFDGVIEGTVTGIKINEYDTAVVALKLADGISGILKLSEKVRIKRLAENGAGAAKMFGKMPGAPVSAEMVFAILSVAVFLIVMGVFFYVIG